MRSGASGLQRRLKSVRSIEQLTRAMKTVAISKYNRTLQQLKVLRPYEEELQRMAAHVAGAADSPSTGSKVLFVVVTANRGLCGSYNTDLWNWFKAHTAQMSEPWQLYLVGHWGIERGREQMGDKVLKTVAISDQPTPQEADALAEDLKSLYATGEYSRVMLVSQRFENILRQEPQSVQLLPREGREAQQGDLLILPDKAAMEAQLQERSFRMRVFALLLEAMAGAHGAMLMAMRTANDNAENMGREMERKLNRLRQSSVTTQVLELARSAAEPLD